jgi:hypothetical protein
MQILFVFQGIKYNFSQKLKNFWNSFNIIYVLLNAQPSQMWKAVASANGT